MRKIIHIDMDAFYASVEQRDCPELKGRPVVVGGKPDSRGVVATCSYEARRYGIRSAMASSHAYKLCSHAVFVHPRFEAYKQASEEIHSIFSEYTELIEPLSLDEAYLDVTDSNLCDGVAMHMAKEIREKIFQQIQLTASAGISYNKFLAKLASDHNKPNGQFVVRPGEADAFLASMPIGKFYGIGKVTEARMQSLGICKGADLKAKSLIELQAMFGNSAEYYHDLARGIDHRPVSNSRTRKSIGSETTFEQDLHDKNEMLQHLLSLAFELLESLEERELLAYTITIKIKYGDFTQITRSYTSEPVISKQSKVLAIIPQLLNKTEVDKRSVRLLGVSFSSLIEYENCIEETQLELF